MATLDAETSKVLSDAEEVESLIGSRGWAYIKDKLDQRILDLQNISNIAGATPEEMMIDMRARIAASTMLYAWQKEDVYGFVEQQKANNATNRATNEEDYIGRDAG